ncbi:PqqD family protein [Demequina maris]|uniref:PqqD family protein n=1 Tax=Demequina maris TaxID=1638982 RepID=UPI0007829E93|nr:PqqD family protein [Demequina maris]
MSAPLARVVGLAEVVRGDAAVVVNLPRLEEQQVPHLFTGPSFEIWRRIDGTRTKGEIADELAVAYGASRDVVAADVNVLVAQLGALGLILEA